MVTDSGSAAVLQFYNSLLKVLHPKYLPLHSHIVNESGLCEF